VLVGHGGDVGERLLGSGRSAAVPPLGRLGDVAHPVRRPQPLQMVGLARTLVDDRPLVAQLAVPALIVVSGRHDTSPAFAPGSTSAFTSSAVGVEFSRRAIHATIASTAASRGTPLSWLRSPNRKLTAPFSMSRSPANSMNGTFWLVWLTIFLAI